MKFSCFLKKVRKDLSLSQQQVVDILVASHSQLYNLNITTYNRWEKDHSTPSTIKIYLIVKILKLDLIETYRTLDLKSSKSKLKSFTDLVNYLDNNQNRFRLLSSALPNFEKFKTFDKDNYSDSLELLAKFKGSVNNFISQSSTEVNSRDLEDFKEMQKSGTMVVAACKDYDTNTYSAHGAWIYINTSYEKDFLSKFKKQSLRMRNFNIVDKEQDTFIFIIPPSLHSSTWNHYFTSELIKETLKNPPQKLYTICLSSDALRLYFSLGFKTELSISNQMKINSNINDANSFGTTYLLSIDYKEFISHPGIIKFIKESELFS
ncbi:helix-turn-helix transcriptional regulator [Vibrio alginolyticus]